MELLVGKRPGAQRDIEWIKFFFFIGFYFYTELEDRFQRFSGKNPELSGMRSGKNLKRMFGKEEKKKKKKHFNIFFTCVFHSYL